MTKLKPEPREIDLYVSNKKSNEKELKEHSEFIKECKSKLTSLSKRSAQLQYNKEIDAAVSRVRKGKSVSNEEVMTEMNNW